MSKLIWVVLPLALYGGWAALAALRAKLPPRHVLNMHTSLLLMAYLLVTAGLGIFWVANQQLPVFDLHYLFGYGTLLLVGVHLSFNLPLVLRSLRKGATTKTTTAARPRRVATAVLTLALTAAAFFLGMRHGRSELELPWGAAVEFDRGPIDAVARYHEFSSLSKRGVLARAPSTDWGEKPPPFKHYDGVKVDLPQSDAAGRPIGDALRTTVPGATDLSRADVASILFHAGGVTVTRGGYKLRAAPTSGGLAPTELYLHAVGVVDLPDGLYHYDAEHHHLVRLGDATLDGTAVVVTSVFRRTGHKYRDRAYRYAIADAGHLLENLRIAAAELGYVAIPRERFDESSVAAAVAVDGIEEGIVAVVPLTRGEFSERQAMWRFLEPPDSTDIGVTGIVHRATSLRALVESATALPEPDWPSAPVLQTIRTRRSKRRFSDEAVPLAQLSAVLAASRGPGPLLSRSIRVNFVANRVTDLEPGVYRYLPGSHTVKRVRSGDFSGEARAAGLSQDVIGDAAVVFVLAGERRSMFADHGARGYRHAFLEVGMVGERMMLGAHALGLAACPVGAFYDDDAASLIEVDPNVEWVLHFAALGVD